MSRDIFTHFPSGAQSSGHDGFPDGSLSRARNQAISFNAMHPERDSERARQEVEMMSPENRQKAAETEAAERERKWIDFHFKRAIPRFLEAGWKHIRQELTDEEIRVYTTDYDSRRFWGIKPAGIGMNEFWELNDPEVTRYNDNIAVTWEDPLIRPAVTAFSENKPTIWAGRGVNPDLKAPEPPAVEAPLPTTGAKSKRRQKIPEVDPIHRVRKSKTPSPKINKKGNRKKLAEKTNAGPSRPEDPTQEEPSSAPTTDGPSQTKTVLSPSTTQQLPTPDDQLQLPSKRPRQQPTHTAKPAPAPSSPQPPKRPRGRPAKPKPATKDAVTSSPKRPRGRPPGKGKSTAVKGNAGVTKTPSQQKGRRALAPSTHVMRTRGKGTAELLQL